MNNCNRKDIFEVKTKRIFVEAIISDETLNFEPIRELHHETNHTAMKTIDFKIGTVNQENFL